MCIFFCICFGLNALINISNNRHVVHESNKFYKYPRDLLKKGLYKKTDDNIQQSTIIIRN